MHRYLCVIRFGMAIGCLLYGTDLAEAQDFKPVFSQLVATMEEVLPQPSRPTETPTPPRLVTRADLPTLVQVLNGLATVTAEPVPVQAQVSFVPQTQTIIETINVPVVGPLGRRVQSFLPMNVQRQVTVMVPTTTTAASQGAQVRPSPQTQSPSPQSPSPQAPPLEPPTMMTTIERNRNALLQEIGNLLAKDPTTVSPSDETDPPNPANPAAATSFRHLAIQTYALVISAQRLSLQDPPSAEGTFDTAPGSVINLPKP